MILNDELWRQHQYQVIVSFVHHLAYSRSLRKLYSDMRQKSEFWTRTVDAHLLRAVIDWCMVFGTDSSGIHWKKVIADVDTQSDFRLRLLSLGNLTQDQWDAYWLEMTTFRNDFAAHRIVASTYPTTPKMDTALFVAINYDKWIRERIRQSSNAIFEEPSLHDRYDRVIRTSGKFLAPVIALGPTIDQEYEGNVPPLK